MEFIKFKIPIKLRYLYTCQDIINNVCIQNVIKQNDDVYLLIFLSKFENKTYT